MIVYRGLPKTTQARHFQDAVVKRELFDRHIRHRYDIVAVLDDRKQVAEGDF